MIIFFSSFFLLFVLSQWLLFEALLIEDKTVVGVCTDALDAIDSMVVPAGVETIGAGAFIHCWQLISVTLPRGLTTIDAHAFRNAYNLTYLTLPVGLTTIGKCAFENAWGLTSLTLPVGLTTIGDFAFKYCRNLSSLTLPVGLKKIGAYAFLNCKSLTSIQLPCSLTSIGRFAFSRCNSLTFVSLHYSLENFGNLAFHDCDMYISFVYRPPSLSKRLFIVWAVSNSRHRDNWQLTTLKHSRNVLRLILSMVCYTQTVNYFDIYRFQDHHYDNFLRHWDGY